MNIFRFITRRKWCKKIFLFLPLSWRRKIAGLVHNISQKARRGAGKPREILAVDDQAVRQMLAQHQAQQIIHGHVHETDIVSILLADNKSSKRFVLGEWTSKGGDMLLCYDDGRCELKKFL